ncbi:hypothetical protein HHI36_024396, partial [Cryptolaemus montrouzieri]
MSKSQLNDDGNNSFDTNTYNTDLEVNAVADTACDQQVAPVVLGSSSDELCDVAKSETKFFPEEDAGLSKNLDATMKRYRRTGVYEISNDSENKSSEFYQMEHNSVQETLVENIFSNDNEKLTIPPVSGYCSSTASAGSEDEFDKAAFRKKIVRRCESSDSAIVHSDEETVTVHSNWGEKKEEIDELPYSYPVFSPYSPRRSIDHESVPRKTLIEAQFVPFPLDRKQSDCFSENSDLFTNDSRRQSCFTDDDEVSRYRYWRTPSVVVSDYSDDPMGLTLDDIEYIRNQHLDNSSSPDSSLHSSCSNLNLCGSNPETFRKVSDCSTCSFSGDEDSEYSRE